MTSRIIITIKGGVAEVADAQEWPEGLELYIVDYDAFEGDYREDMPDVDGECDISCYIGVGDKCGPFAERVAKEYSRSNAS
jgi:hypothetical protein